MEKYERHMIMTVTRLALMLHEGDEYNLWIGNVEDILKYIVSDHPELRVYTQFEEDDDDK